MKTNNNKLANYIDNVRRLQKENMRMVRQIEVIEVSQVKEINDLKVCYDREISDLKEAIRKMQDNYKNLQQNSEKILTENMDLKKLQERKNQEYEMKALLRDMAIYACYTIVVLIVSYGNRDYNNFIV